jgi:hypothetical protein
MRKAVIREADVVVTTLSGCGVDVYAVCMESFMAKKKSRGRAEEDFFSAVVIDEAGQVNHLFLRNWDQKCSVCYPVCQF